MLSGQTAGVEIEEADRAAPQVEPLLTEAQARERSREFRECSRQLLSATPSARVQAVQRLAAFGATALEPLQRAIVDLEPQVQVTAVRALREIGGPGAVTLLLKAIPSDQLTVRVAAAEALGDLAGEEALEPLKRAYRRCFVGGSARRERVVAPLILLGILVGMALSLSELLLGHGSYFGSMIVNLYWLASFVSIYSEQLRSRLHARSVLTALLKVAERSANSELTDVLPDLRIVARTRWMSNPESREAARLAAEWIVSLPAPLRDLPVPSAAASPSGEILPLPAGAPPLEAQPRSGASS